MYTGGGKKNGGVGESFPHLVGGKEKPFIGVSQSLRELGGCGDGVALEGSLWEVGRALWEWYDLHELRDWRRVLVSEDSTIESHFFQDNLQMFPEHDTERHSNAL